MTEFVKVFFVSGEEFGQAFTDAAAFWNSVITSSPAAPTTFPSPFSVNANTNCGVDFTFPAGTSYDSLAIISSVAPIDGAGSILGRAGPCVFDGIVPVMGIMEFDEADVVDLIADDTFGIVIKHEMAHVIGIGTVWTRSGFLNNPCDIFSIFFGCNPTYDEDNGNEGFHDLGGVGDAPVANTGGSGTQNGHWREVTFEDELMTGFLSAIINPVSIMTIKALKDIGYTVDESLAEEYSLPSEFSVRKESATKIDLSSDGFDVEPVQMKDALASNQALVNQNNELMVVALAFAAFVAVAAAFMGVVYKRRKSAAQEAAVEETSA